MSTPKAIIDTIAALKAERGPLAARLDAIDLAIDNLSRVYGLHGTPQPLPLERRVRERRSRPKKAEKATTAVEGVPTPASERRDIILALIEKFRSRDDAGRHPAADAEDGPGRPTQCAHGFKKGARQDQTRRQFVGESRMKPWQSVAVALMPGGLVLLACAWLLARYRDKRRRLEDINRERMQAAAERWRP